MIYGFCWNDKLKQYDHHKHERPWRASDVDEVELSGDYDSCLEYPVPPHPRAGALRPYPVQHFVNEAHVGADAAREAVEAFYRLAPAYVETLETRRLEDYFNYDNFDVGIVPRDFMNSITFFLDKCSRTRTSHWANSYGYSNNKVPPMQLTEEGLVAIFGTEPRRLPKITFRIRSGMPSAAIDTLQFSHAFYKVSGICAKCIHAS